MFVENSKYTKSILATLAVCAGLILSPALASTNTDAGPSSGEQSGVSQDKRICFFSDAVNGFSPMGEQHLLVRVNASKRYLLTLSHPCRNLRQTPQIVFGSRGNLVCNYSRSRISTGEDKCIISDVQKVDSYSQAKTLATKHTDKTDKNRRQR
jgi:hypothetical protein